MTSSKIGYNNKLRMIIAIGIMLMAVLLLLSLTFIRNPFNSYNYYGRVIDMPAPEFNLKDLDGQEVQLNNFQGKYIYLMFGYLNCNKTCHSQALVLDYLSNGISDNDVHFVYISMDPQRDDVSKLKFYFREKSHRLTILRGNNIRQLQAVANEFKVPFIIKPSVTDSEYEISHPGYIFMINPDGRLSMVYSGNLIDPERLYQDLSFYKSHYS